MVRRSGSTFSKRRKELARQQKRQDKLASRLQKRKERREAREAGLPEEDPDIAGIQPGPQPARDDEF